MNIARNIHMHDKHSKENVLSSKSLSKLEAIRNSKLEAIGVDSCGFSNSQLQVRRSYSSCRWKSDSAKDEYVCGKVD